MNFFSRNSCRRLRSSDALDPHKESLMRARETTERQRERDDDDRHSLDTCLLPRMNHNGPFSSGTGKRLSSLGHTLLGECHT